MHAPKESLNFWATRRVSIQIKDNDCTRIWKQKKNVEKNIELQTVVKLQLKNIFLFKCLHLIEGRGSREELAPNGYVLPLQKLKIFNTLMYKWGGVGFINTRASKHLENFPPSSLLRLFVKNMTKCWGLVPQPTTSCK